MPRDDMRKPLKRQTLRDRLRRRRPGPLPLAAASLLAAFAAAALWLPRIPAPLAGEPVVTAAIPAEAEIITSSTTPADDPSLDDSAATDDAAPAPDEAFDPNAVEIIGGEDPAADGASEAPPPEEAMVIMAPHRPLRSAPVAAVTEKTEQGPLPRIGDNGRRPFEVYSQVTPLAVTQSARPKIALVLGGMGLNAKLTARAIEQLPGDVTLAFAPYGENLQKQVNAARAAGHEILLQVPMEPVGYPGSNPGPSTLLSDAPREQNIAALKWLMSRFAGYSAVTNYMGSRLLASEDALRPVLTEVKARGLAYFEDASVGATLAPQVAQDLRLPVQRATMVIDADPTAPAIAAALARLEKEARRNGQAIATGSGLDVTIETVAEWAKTLQEKGIILVPVSTAYKGRAS